MKTSLVSVLNNLDTKCVELGILELENVINYILCVFRNKIIQQYNLLHNKHTSTCKTRLSTTV